MADKQQPYQDEEILALKKIAKKYPNPQPGELKPEIGKFIKKFPGRTYASAYYKLCVVRDQEAGRPTSYQRAHQKTKKKNPTKDKGWGGVRVKGQGNRKKKTEARHPVKGGKLLMTKNEISIPYTGLRIENGHVIITF